MTSFDAAADLGDPNAQFNLALVYQEGRDRPQDYAAAARWHRKAAHQGHTGAQYGLALMYAKGQGIEKDDAKAVDWYRRAAKRGHQAAQFNLATMYDQGAGVKRDLLMAYVWFALASVKANVGPQSKAANTGGIGFRLTLAASRGSTVTDLNRNRLAQQLPAEYRARADQMVEEYYAKYVRPFR